jgi:Ras GTPase-activating-like protein IQGAP2/3
MYHPTSKFFGSNTKSLFNQLFRFPLINLTISSDETGVFNMEVTLLGASVASKEELRLEDLLARQYNKQDVITLFDTAKVNLNLLIFLINKKFYAQ